VVGVDEASTRCLKSRGKERREVLEVEETREERVSWTRDRRESRTRESRL